MQAKESSSTKRVALVIGFDQGIGDEVAIGLAEPDFSSIWFHVI
ncbi:hypothetical protein [Algoriphagus resistens]|nr:hypothetical protein [Algoriphagus resistens]